MINDQHYIKLFTNILPVKGAKQSILCDAQRGEYRVIPEDLYDLLIRCDGQIVSEIIDEFGENNRDVILEYFTALYREECIFFCDTKEEVNCFPALDLTFDTPSIITNAILDVDSKSNHNLTTLFSQLDGLGCENIEIRIFESVHESVYQEIYDCLVDSLIEYCVLITPFNPNMGLKDYQDILKNEKRIGKIIVHSVGERRANEIQQNTGKWPIYFTKQVINNAECCGNISAKYFNMNLRFITEAKKHNSCLNKKISIDREGNIKNCPAMQNSFGKLDSNLLIDVVKLQQFQELWNVNKDQIAVCKDCEFRYICHDCRALITEPNNQYSKPLKCKYNPYKAIWEN